MGKVSRSLLASAILWALLSALLLAPDAAFAQAAQEDHSFRAGSAITSPIIQGFVAVGRQLAQSFATRAAAEALTLLNYAFLIWILLQVAQMMLGMSSGGGTFWSIVRRSAIYMVLAFMLTAITTGAYWTWFVEEPIRIAANASSVVMRNGSCSGGAAATAGCLARQLELIFTEPMHAGLVNMRSTPLSLTGAAASQFIAGALLMLVSFIGIAFFAFFILDVVLRILVMAMFSPIFVAAFLFNPTRGWATGAAWNLVGSVVTLVGAAAVLAILRDAMTALLGGSNWAGVVAQIAASGSQYNSPVNLDRAVFWQALFLTLVSVGTAKAISQMMASVFNSAPVGSPMADKAAGIAAIPVKAAVTAATLAAGALTYIGARGAIQASGWGAKKLGRGIGSGIRWSAENLKNRFGRFQFGSAPLGGGGGFPSGGSPGGGSGGGGSGGGGLGGGSGGSGGSAFGPGFGASGSGSAGTATAQTGPNASGAQTTASAGPDASAQTAATGAAAATAGSKPNNPGNPGKQDQQDNPNKKKKGPSAYKGAFVWEAVKRTARSAGEAVDPNSDTRA
jgi:hypothetical protein